jgi:hypothetical protein
MLALPYFGMINVQPADVKIVKGVKKLRKYVKTFAILWKTSNSDTKSSRRISGLSADVMIHLNHLDHERPSYTGGDYLGCFPDPSQTVAMWLTREVAAMELLRLTPNFKGLVKPRGEIKWTAEQDNKFEKTKRAFLKCWIKLRGRVSEQYEKNELQPNEELIRYSRNCFREECYVKNE